MFFSSDNKLATLLEVESAQHAMQALFTRRVSSKRTGKTELVLCADIFGQPGYPPYHLEELDHSGTGVRGCWSCWEESAGNADAEFLQVQIAGFSFGSLGASFTNSLVFLADRLTHSFTPF